MHKSRETTKTEKAYKRIEDELLAGWLNSLGVSSRAWNGNCQK